jgi:hypothetical protein
LAAKRIPFDVPKFIKLALALFEDDRDKAVIFFETRIVRTAEALLHCANLYRALGTEPNALINLTVRYGGLRGRVLKAASQFVVPPIMEDKNEIEDESTVSVSFRLSFFGVRNR